MVSALENTIAVVSSLPDELVHECVSRITGLSSGWQWPIENKYYTADVLFRRFEGIDESAGAPAILVLVDGTEAVQAIAKVAPAEIRADVALVAGHYGDQPTLIEQIEACTNACIELGCEYVPLFTSWVGAEAEDLDGISRLREALQTHAWPASARTQPLSSAPAGAGTTGFDDDFAPFQSAPPAVQGEIGDLFQHLQGLRAQAELITDVDERRLFAQRVALLFESELENIEEIDALVQ